MMGKARNCYRCEASGFRLGGPAQSDSRLIDVVKSGYVELTGATHPVAFKGVETPPTTAVAPSNPAQAQAASETGNKPSGEPHKVYEYCWNVGVTGFNTTWYNELNGNDPIVIQIILHAAESTYSVQEVAATLKQVPPYRKTKQEEIEDWIDLLRPIVETTGHVLEAGGLGTAGKIISSISKMKLNSVPVDKFPWYVKTFSVGQEAGIEWHIPRALIDSTGNRLSGSLGLMFVDCGGAEANQAGASQAGGLALEMRAFLRDRDGCELFLSPTDRKTLLPLSPA